MLWYSLNQKTISQELGVHELLIDQVTNNWPQVATHCKARNNR